MRRTNDMHATLANLIAQTISPGERLDAVHKYFEEQGQSQGLGVLWGGLLFALGLCAVLMVLNRIQLSGRRREEAARDRQRAARKQTANPTVQTTRTMSLLQKQRGQPGFKNRTFS